MVIPRIVLFALSLSCASAVTLDPETAVAVTTDVKEGTASADVSTAALDDNGGNIQVTIKNNTGVAWHDVTVEFIKKASGDSRTPSVGGGTLHNPTGGSHSATATSPTNVSGGQKVTFPAGQGQHDFGPKFTGGSETLTCLLTGCNGAGNTTNVIRVTPSSLVANEESSLLGTYDFSVATDVIRKGNVATWHAQVVARVVNRNTSAALVQLNGAMTLPTGIALDGVTVRSNADGYTETPGVSVTQNGSTFQVTGLDLDSNEEILVVANLSAAVGGDEAKLLLEATFDA